MHNWLPLATMKPRGLGLTTPKIDGTYDTKFTNQYYTLYKCLICEMRGFKLNNEYDITPEDRVECNAWIMKQIIL